eukprot:m.1480953 g.1480953  ORF g.1480953 m.1480953 type:complete len:1704 (+) comp25172_c0_seq1:294-5405(+)
MFDRGDLSSGNHDLFHTGVESHASGGDKHTDIWAHAVNDLDMSNKVHKTMKHAEAQANAHAQPRLQRILEVIGLNHEDLRKSAQAKSPSLFIFPFDSVVRRYARRITGSKKFDNMILTFIVANCLCLAITTPFPDKDTDTANVNLELAEKIFVVIFTFEMMVKVISMGFYFCGEQSYIRIGWNQLDFVIVIVGIVSWALENIDLGGIKALRAFRVLRPLKLISNIESLQIVLNSLMKAIPKLINVAGLLMFFMVIYAIIGLEFYRDYISQTCYEYSVDEWNQTHATAIEDSACSQQSDRGVQCDANQVCEYDSYPRAEGMQSFNNAGTALLTVFICTTQEGWTEVLYIANNTTGASGLNWLYFVSLIILGSFLITNLMLGVISGQFTREGEKLQLQVAHKKAMDSAREKEVLDNYQEWMHKAEHIHLVRAKPTVEEPKISGRQSEEYTSGTGDVLKKSEPVDEEIPEDDKLIPKGMKKYAESDGDHVLFGDGELPSNQYSEEAEDDAGGIESLRHNQDNEDQELPLLLIRLPDGTRIPVGVNMKETLGMIKRRIQYCLPKNCRYVLQPDGIVLSDSTKVEEFNILLRRPEELEAINHMDHNNKRALLKQSSLTILSWSGSVAKSRSFTVFIMMVVFLNTCTLGAEHYPQPQVYTDIFFYSEIAFISIFLLECAFKIYAFSFKQYWSSKFNRVDFIVVVLSLLEFSLVQGAGIPSTGISVLRCVRLMRVFRYTSYWEGMNDLANALVDSISSISSLLLLLLIFMMIAALLGMQLFGGRFNFTAGTPRSNFNSFADALLAMFQVLTGEDWNVVMGDGITSYGGIEEDGWIAVIFFCSFVILGAFILLNVFLAIAVGALDEATSMREIRRRFHEEWDGVRPGKKGIEPEPEGGKPKLNFKMDPIEAEDKPEDSVEGFKYTSFCFGVKSNFRRNVSSLAFIHRDDLPPKPRQVFEGFILLCILASSLCLAAEDPVNEDAQINKDLYNADIFFTAVFTIEMTVKMISLGLVWHPGSYLRNGWNRLDFVVVVGSILNFALADLGAVKILRTLRVLRPLRAIKRAKGLEHVVRCMIISVKTIGNVFIITMLLIFMFAVVGVQLFKGTFHYCTDRSIRLEADCVGTFVSYESLEFAPRLASAGVEELFEPAGVLQEREWERPANNFDNIFNAMINLFSASTTEGWVATMYNGVDSTHAGEGPLQNNRPYVATFFVLYIVVLTFFMINIFVGYVVTTFSSEGEEQYRETGMNKNQRKCVDFVLEASPPKKYQPIYRLQVYITPFVESKLFETVIIAAIFGNTIQLMMQYQGMSSGYQDVLQRFNNVFISIFTFEAMAKLVAYNPTVYFSDNWNVMDFIIVIGGLVDVIGGGVNIGFLRLFRVARVIKIITKGDDMRKLLFTFLNSFKALPYVVLLIVLCFFMYAVIGMFLFAKIPLNDDTSINHNNNFRTFFSALMVLFRCATGEAWQDIMYDCWKEPNGTVVSVIYFCTFTLICTFLIINLFVAVIMDNFEYLTLDESVLGAQHLNLFIDVWQKYDPAGTKCVSHHNLPDLLRELDPPLGVGDHCSDQAVSQYLLRMNIPVASDGTVDFNATMLSIVRMRLSMYNDLENGWENENARLKDILLRFWPRADYDLLDKMLPAASVDNVTVGLLHAVFLMQGVYRTAKADSDLETRRLSAGPPTGVLFRNPGLVKRVLSEERLDLLPEYDESTL